MLSSRLLRSFFAPPPARALVAAAPSRAYSGHRRRGSRPSLWNDDSGGWYGQPLRATTILSVRKDDKVFVIGDGQVTLGSQVIKPNARKVRQLKEGVICGFAGATADAMTLFERLEGQLQAHPETMRACVEMAKAWRMDKYLRRLEAVMIVCDKNVSLTLTGTGDVIEPEDGIIGIGSGGMYATAAARALVGVDGLDAADVGRRAMTIAADIHQPQLHRAGAEQGRGCGGEAGRISGERVVLYGTVVWHRGAREKRKKGWIRVSYPHARPVSRRAPSARRFAGKK